MAAVPEDPHSRPPSYSLLGVLILVRLLYRLIALLRARARTPSSELIPPPSSPSTYSPKGKAPASPSGSPTPTRHQPLEIHIDGRPVSSLLNTVDPESAPALPAEDDELTILDVASIPEEVRAGRSCTLCLEERTASAATECGHLFCWSCVYGWGREKVSGVVVLAVEMRADVLMLCGLVVGVSTLQTGVGFDEVVAYLQLVVLIHHLELS